MSSATSLAACSAAQPKPRTEGIAFALTEAGEPTGQDHVLPVAEFQALIGGRFWASPACLVNGNQEACPELASYLEV